MLSCEGWTKPSLAHFISWLETKDPKEEYKWELWTKCACGQYAKFIGEDDWIDKIEAGIWSWLNILAQPGCHDQHGNYEMTFGELLKRCRIAKASPEQLGLDLT